MSSTVVDTLFLTVLIPSHIKLDILQGLGYKVEPDHDRPLLNHSAIPYKIGLQLVLGEPEWVQLGGDDSHHLTADWPVSASGRRFSAFSGRQNVRGHR